MRLLDLLTESVIEHDAHNWLIKTIHSIKRLNLQFSDMVNAIGYQNAVDKISRQLANMSVSWYLHSIAENDVKTRKLLKIYSAERSKLISRIESGV